MADSIRDFRLGWEVGNSVYIWITIALLLALLFATSVDPANPSQFTIGENQILLLGFITLLLLFKYISKIKIGPVEIEFKMVENKLGSASGKLRAVNVSQLTVEEVNAQSEAIKDIEEAYALVQLMRTRYT